MKKLAAKEVPAGMQKYKTADVIFDGGSGIPSAHMYFLNTDYIKIKPHYLRLKNAK